MFTKKKAAVRMARGAGPLVPSGYTRNDIGCGMRGCALCGELNPASASTSAIDAGRPTIFIPDTNILLHNMNVVEDPRVHNIVLLSTVLAEVNNRNKAVYARLQRVLSDESKACFAFANDRHEQTFCARNADEGPNDYNDRCIRVAGQWYARHVAAAFPESSVSVCLVSHDKALVAIAATTAAHGVPSCGEAAGDGPPPTQGVLHCVGLREYLRRAVSEDSDLLDKLQYLIPEGMKESPSTGALFDEHWAPDALTNGILAGTLFKGKLRVSETNCFFGEIRGKWEGHAFDRILVVGRRHMNRSIHDDVVAVELLPTSQWKGPSRAAAPLADGTPEESALEQKYVPCGRVVGIVEERRRPFCGSLDIEDLKRVPTGSTGNVAVLFQPKNNRIPRIRIHTNRIEDLAGKRLCVVLDDWAPHSSFPNGHYTDILGPIGDKDTEAKVILMENDIPHYDFSEAVYNCLPKGEWKVTDDVLAHRVDLRDLCVVSVDPLGCRDIDDALHCRVINGNHYEVGVHIADVTHFLEENSAMDVEALKRSTSVYLVDRRIDMLPKLLTENLCSIVANEDRLAFSVLWEFDENFNVVRTFFGKSVIRSRAALYYGDAQKMIDDPDDMSDMAMSLKRLMKLSQFFKKQREKAGALFLASQEFKFKVDNDHVNPTDMHAYQSFEANSMIEEWMLFANAAVARRIYESYPHWTLLRRHQCPAENAFDTLNEALQRHLNVTLDGTTSLALNRSLDRCVDPNDDYFNKLIRILTTRCMRQAQYFSSSEFPPDEFVHYGLAMPIYTHFTSPIRRYSDVVVHRQLAAAIGIASVSENHMKPEKMEAIAANMNYRHEQAQKAGRDSQNLFTGFFLRNFSDSKIPTEPGYVVKLTDTHVFVLVPKYGQEGRVLREHLTRVPDLLSKVQVDISVRQDGDALRTKMTYTLVDYSAGRPRDDVGPGDRDVVDQECGEPPVKKIREDRM